MIFYFYFFFLSFEFVQFFNGDIETFGTQTSWQLITEWNGTGFVASVPFPLCCCKGVADFWDCLAHTALLPLFACFLLSPIRRFSPVTPRAPSHRGEGRWKIWQISSIRSLKTLFSVPLMPLKIVLHQTNGKSLVGQRRTIEKWINAWGKLASWECACGCTKLFGHRNWFIDF